MSTNLLEHKKTRKLAQKSEAQNNATGIAKFLKVRSEVGVAEKAARAELLFMS